MSKLHSIFKFVFIAASTIILIVAAYDLPAESLTFGYGIILLLSILLVPRLSFSLPRSNFTVTFGDALIFLTFLLYGGEAAIILAFIETLASVIYLKRNTDFVFGEFMMLVNPSISTIATAATFAIISQFSAFNGHIVESLQTPQLIILLGLLAGFHFLFSTLFAAIFHSFKTRENVFTVWKKECLASGMTYIVGIGIAGFSYKIIQYGDLVAVIVSFIALAVAYLTYRNSVNDVVKAIENIERVESEKSGIERKLREEAETLANELAILLKKEEASNKALRRSEQDFQFAAQHDSLTGLANRKKLSDILKVSISNFKENPERKFSLLFLDIKGFKEINDSLGHTVGDKVLALTAKRLVRIVKADDVVARIGGDEFSILLRNVNSVEKTEKIAKKISSSLNESFSVGGNRITISVSIGIAACTKETDSPEDILRDADIAMHYAKENDGQGFAAFNRQMRVQFLERVQLARDMQHAVERNEFLLNYQPIISLKNGTITGLEALIRWHHPMLGLVPPNRFIPIAEDSGLIVPISKWILKTAATQTALWQRFSPPYQDLYISVNISGKHLVNDCLITDVEEALSESGLTPASLRLEITESVAMKNTVQTLAMLDKLKDLGVQLSLDDFGTGYSSLSYLNRLPLDTLKIDRSFVNNAEIDKKDAHTLQAIIALSHNLNMDVIAEGIETEAQIKLLSSMNCQFGQGFYFSKPKDADNIQELLLNTTTLFPAGLLEEIEQISGITEFNNNRAF